MEAPDPETKIGKKATEFLEKIIKFNAEVYLEVDIEKRDKYGRLLAYVYQPTDVLYNKKFKHLYTEFSKNCDGYSCEMINAMMVKAGYAQPMTISPNVKYAGLFKKLYEEAKK